MVSLHSRGLIFISLQSKTCLKKLAMDNLYPITPLKKPNFFQRLFKITPKENAIIEINNLLGSRPLYTIEVDEIEVIAARYKVNLHRKFNSRLMGLYQRYLQRCLSDNNLSEDELNALNSLKHLLALSDNEVTELHNKLVSDIYRKSYEAAISGGKLEKSTEDLIDALQQNIRLPEEIARKISDMSRNHFMDMQLKKIVADRRVSPEEWSEFTQIARNLNVTVQFDDATKQQLEKFKHYWLIEKGELPVLEVNINLPKSEQCYFTTEAVWLENRTVTQRINYGGPALRIKIMKGVYYRAGSVGVQRITSEQLQEIDNGTLYITNKRIIFTGNKKNSNILLSKVLSVTPYSDGVGIEKDTGKSPILRVSGSADILAMMLGRVINDL